MSAATIRTPGAAARSCQGRATQDQTKHAPDRNRTSWFHRTPSPAAGAAVRPNPASPPPAGKHESVGSQAVRARSSQPRRDAEGGRRPRADNKSININIRDDAPRQAGPNRRIMDLACFKHYSRVSSNVARSVGSTLRTIGPELTLDTGFDLASHGNFGAVRIIARMAECHGRSAKSVIFCMRWAFLVEAGYSVRSEGCATDAGVEDLHRGFGRGRTSDRTVAVSSVVAGPGLVLSSSAPVRPSDRAVHASDGCEDERGEQAADLVAQQRDQTVAAGSRSPFPLRVHGWRRGRRRRPCPA